MATEVSNVFKAREQAISTGPENEVVETGIELVPPNSVCASSPAPRSLLSDEC
jgi:hypothetical protein